MDKHNAEYFKNIAVEVIKRKKEQFLETQIFKDTVKEILSKVAEKAKLGNRVVSYELETTNWYYLIFYKISNNWDYDKSNYLCEYLQKEYNFECSIDLDGIRRILISF